MIKGISYSKKRIIAATAASVAAVLALLVREQFRREAVNERTLGAARERALNVQIEGRSDYDDAHLQALRQKVSQFRMQLGESGTWDRLLRRLGVRWVAETSTATDHPAYTIHSGTFRMVAPTVSDWPEILEIVHFVEETPGAAIGDFRMKAGNPATPRALGLVSIVIVVHSNRVGPALSSL